MGPKQTVALFGECMIELQGEAFGTMRQSFGGDTLNTAIYLARLGSARGIGVRYATALGTDPFSDGMLERWHTEGIETGLVRRLPDKMPGLYAIQVGADGERQFSYWRDNSAARFYFDTEITPLEAAATGLDALYFSGISLAILSPSSRDRLLATAESVRGRGGKVIFDNNYRPRLWSNAAQARQVFARAYALADIALVTLDDELRLHDDRAGENAVQRCLDLPCPEVVLKRGADSTLLKAAGDVHVAPTVRVERVIDTTAAGDSFAGAYLARRLSGGTAAESARDANALAAKVVQHSGAVIPLSAMP